MANRIRFPFLNPVPLYDMSPAVVPQYNSRHIDAHPYFETIESWQAARPFQMPWQVNDSIRLQFMSDYGPIKLRLVDGYERTVVIQAAVQRLRSAFEPDFYVYEADISLAGIAEGVYFLLLEAGDDGSGAPVERFISEPLKILANQKNTLYLEYKHYRFKGTCIFETGFAPALRIPGRLVLKSPSAKDTFFEDEELSQRLVDGKPYEVWELQVGGPSGIPDGMAKRLNRMLTCSDTRLDGIRYTKAGQQDLQPSAERGYPMRSWAIDLRDTENKDHAEYSNNAYNAGPGSMIISVDRKGFGTSSSGEEQIISID
jgi:hypothetical protein